MSLMATKNAMAAALAAAALASSLAAPAASAGPVEQFIPSAAGGATDAVSVPPPPSSIAASAGGEYEELRASGSAGSEPHPAVGAPAASGGFDLASAVLGAAGGTGLMLVLLAAREVTRNRRRLPRLRGA
jgi:hypothetical protein